MKVYVYAITAAALLHTSIAGADVVKQEVPDTIVGKGFGALAGFMVGATGGPVGAVVGALVGGLSFSAAQKVTGLHGSAYLVQRKDGSEQVVRSPNRQWRTGDEVEVFHDRLVEARQHTD